MAAKPEQMNTGRRLLASALLALMVGTAAVAGRDRYGGQTSLGLEATGFFRLDEVGGRSWLVTPDGHRFYSQGVAVSPGGPDSGRGGLAGTGQLARRLRGWGFNSWGPGPLTNGAGLAYAPLLDLGRIAIKAGAAAGPDFPDVFDSRFEAEVGSAAARACAALAADPWLLGYFTDQGLDWGDVSPLHPNLLARFLGLPESSPGRQGALRFLIFRYHRVSALNQAWKSDFSSFEQVGRGGALPDQPGVEADITAFLKLVAERYLDAVRSAVRAADPRHLLFGPILPVSVPRPVVEAMGKRVDLIPVDGSTPLPPVELLVSIDELVDRPVLLVGCPGGEQAVRYLEAAARIPYVVGCHLCSWQGLADDGAGQPTELASKVARFNQQTFEIAARSGRLFHLITLSHHYELRRAPRTIAIDGDLREWSQAAPMELHPVGNSRASGVLHLMWDDGHLYLAGRIIDPALPPGGTLTWWLGNDWLELWALGRAVQVKLAPLERGIYLGSKRSSDSSLIVRPLTAAESGGEPGYLFEGAVRVAMLAPAGFTLNFGVALHRSHSPEESRLVYPFWWSRADPESFGRAELAGEAER